MCLLLKPILAKSRLLIAAGTRAAAIKIPGATIQVGLKIELVPKALIVRIAAIVTMVVSTSKRVFSRFDLMPKSGADPMAGSGLVILNCLDG